MHPNQLEWHFLLQKLSLRQVFWLNLSLFWLIFHHGPLFGHYQTWKKCLIIYFYGRVVENWSGGTARFLQAFGESISTILINFFVQIDGFNFLTYRRALLGVLRTFWSLPGLPPPNFRVNVGVNPDLADDEAVFCNNLELISCTFFVPSAFETVLELLKLTSLILTEKLLFVNCYYFLNPRRFVNTKYFAIK